MKNKINTTDKLKQIAKIAQADTKVKFTSLAYLLNEKYLMECYQHDNGEESKLDNRSRYREFL